MNNMIVLLRFYLLSGLSVDPRGGHRGVLYETESKVIKIFLFFKTEIFLLPLFCKKKFTKNYFFEIFGNRNFSKTG